MTDVAAAAPVVKTPKKKATNKAPKKPADHPKYSEMVHQALGSLKERGGSSRMAILKYIMKNFKVGNDEKVVNTHLKMALRAGVKNASLKQAKGSGAAGSFRLGEEAKKKPKAAKKPKVAKKATKPKSPKKAAKKAATKKPKTDKPKKAKADKPKKAKADKPKKASPKKAAKPKKAAAPKPKVAKPKVAKPKAAKKSPVKKAKKTAAPKKA